MKHLYSKDFTVFCYHENRGSVPRADCRPDVSGKERVKASGLSKEENVFIH